MPLEFSHCTGLQWNNKQLLSGSEWGQSLKLTLSVTRLLLCLKAFQNNEFSISGEEPLSSQLTILCFVYKSETHLSDPHIHTDGSFVGESSGQRPEDRLGTTPLNPHNAQWLLYYIIICLMAEKTIKIQPNRYQHTRTHPDEVIVHMQSTSWPPAKNST